MAARPKPAETVDPTPPTFEEMLDRLEKVVARLDAGDLPLEESLAVFEEGVRLSREAQRRLDEAERRVELLLADGDRLETRPLELEKERGRP